MIPKAVMVIIGFAVTFAIVVTVTVILALISQAIEIILDDFGK